MSQHIITAPSKILRMHTKDRIVGRESTAEEHIDGWMDVILDKALATSCQCLPIVSSPYLSAILATGTRDLYS